jgi:cation transport ATPase
MEKLAELSHGAKVVLGAAIAFLLFSFFSWFHYTGPGADQINALGGDTGITMWHGVGWIAGLLAIALIVWQAIRLANINLEIGVTPSMVTAALAVLLVIFAVIRFLDKPGGDFVGRTFWAWLCLVLAIVVVVGAWMNMRAAGEGLADIRSQMSSAAAPAKDVVDRDDTPAAAPAAPAAAPTDTAPVEPPAPGPPPPVQPSAPDAEAPKSDT